MYMPMNESQSKEYSKYPIPTVRGASYMGGYGMKYMESGYMAYHNANPMLDTAKPLTNLDATYSHGSHKGGSYRRRGSRNPMNMGVSGHRRETVGAY